MGFVVTCDKAPGAEVRLDNFTAAAKEARQLHAWGFGTALVMDRSGKVCFRADWPLKRDAPPPPGISNAAVARRLGIVHAGVRDLARRLGLKPAAVKQAGKLRCTFWSTEAVAAMERVVFRFREEARREAPGRKAQYLLARKLRSVSTVDSSDRRKEPSKTAVRTKFPHLVALFEWVEKHGREHSRDNTPEELFRGHVRLALNLAFRSARKLPIELDDAISAAFHGLARAIRTYDPERSKFTTYAHYAISQQIAKHAMCHPRGVPVSLPVGWTRQVKKSTDPHEPCHVAARAAALRTLRIGRLDEDDAPFELADRNQVDPGEAEERALELSKLEQAMRFLDQRDREVVAARFGLGGREKETLPQIGDRLGISKERVRQIEVRAIEKLRKLMEVNT